MRIDDGRGCIEKRFGDNVRGIPVERLEIEIDDIDVMLSMSTEELKHHLYTLLKCMDHYKRRRRPSPRFTPSPHTFDARRNPYHEEDMRYLQQERAEREDMLMGEWNKNTHIPEPFKEYIPEKPEKVDGLVWSED